MQQGYLMAVDSFVLEYYYNLLGWPFGSSPDEILESTAAADTSIRIGSQEAKFLCGSSPTSGRLP